MFFPCPRSRSRIWSPSACPFSSLGLNLIGWCLLTGFRPLFAMASIYLYRQPPSGQSRVYRVTQLRTEDVHCRESAGAGPDFLKVVPVTGAALSGIAMDQFLGLSFSTPTIDTVDMCLCVCVCVSCHPTYSGRQACGRTSRGHTEVTQDFSTSLLRCLP